MRASRRAILALVVALAGPGSVRAAETTAFVLTTDFSTGRLSAVNLDTRAVSRDVGREICADASLRWFNGLLWVVNRFGCDNILALDPAHGFSLVRQFSVGNGSNPHDICFLTPERAYVTCYGRSDLLIVNPSTGATLGQIPLAPFADADGIPEMDRMVRVGDLVFVALQRLDEMNGFRPTDVSLVAVIDAEADTVLDVDPAIPGGQAIVLTGKNPVTTFAIDGVSGRLLVGCAGRYGQPDGGIEWVDPAGFASLGYAITETALGGDVLDFAWNGAAHSYAIVSDASFNTALVSWSAGSGERIGTIFSPGGFSLSDCELNDRGELYLCDNDRLAPGLFVFSTPNDQRVAGPLDTGLPPFQVAFGDAPDAVPVMPGPLAFAPPSPNPARGLVRLALALARAGDLRIEVFDTAGRRLHEWALGERPTGPAELEWDLRDAAGLRLRSGVYFVRARLDDISIVRRLVVLY